MNADDAAASALAPLVAYINVDSTHIRAGNNRLVPILKRIWSIFYGI